MTPILQAEQLAQQIDPHAHPWWQTNGPTLFQAIERAIQGHIGSLLIAEWPVEKREWTSLLIAQQVIAWDRAYSWDSANMSQEEEEHFYRAMVRFMLDLEVSRRTLPPPKA